MAHDEATEPRRRAPLTAVAVMLLPLLAPVDIPAPTVPDEVGAAFGVTAADVAEWLPDVVYDAPNQKVELTVGPIHQLFGFTEDWLTGAETDTPVEPAEQWIAAVSLDGSPVAVLQVADGGSGSPEIVGSMGSASLAAALDTVPLTGIVVTEVTGGQYYQLDGDTLVPLAPQVTWNLTEPTPLADAQALITARVADGRGQWAAMERDERRRTWLVGGAVALSLALAALAMRRRKARVPATPAAPDADA